MKNLKIALIYFFLLQLVAFQALADSYRDVLCNNRGQMVVQGGPIVSRDFKSVADCNGLIALLQRQSAATEFITSLHDRSLSQGFHQAASFAENGFSQKGCEVKAHRYHLSKSKDGYITSECVPEVLYSWGGFDKLNWFLNNMGGDGNWQSAFPRSLFTTSSAAATLGYGPVSIRIKVKPSVRFRLVFSPAGNTCDYYLAQGYINRETRRNTIVTRLVLRDNGVSFMEHAICASDVIDSWSYGMPEHFDEVLRDHHWMTTQHYFQWEAYSKENGVDKYLDNDLDSAVSKYMAVYSIEILRRRMGFLRALSLEGFGQVIAPSAAARARHFKINKPNYFLRSVD